MRLFFLLLAFLSFQTEDLSKPPSIEIAAPAAQVKALILKHYASETWKLEKETDSSLTFSRRAGMKSRLAYGGEPRAVDEFVLVQGEDSITIICNMAVEVLRAGGRVERYNWNADKASRKAMLAFLGKLKAQAEPQASL